MFFEAELRLLQNTFRKCRIQTMLLDPDVPVSSEVDFGLWGLVNGDDKYDFSFRDMVIDIRPATLYKMKDSFYCCYLFCVLPHGEKESVLLIGPYLSRPLNEEWLMQQAENRGMDARLVRILEEYYRCLPYLPEDSHLFALLDSFAELIWSGEVRYSVVDLERDAPYGVMNLPLQSVFPENSDASKSIQLIENVYSYENEIMKAVSQGQTHKVDMMLSGLSAASFQRRLADPVRNLKNYCIIMNTLFRKAAESGGVHPVYLDRVSSDIARKIELIKSTDEIKEFMAGIFRTYCRLVKAHSTKRYSPLVQKTITYIDFDLTQDLSLHALATMLNVSPSYFSALFKQEVGQTLTDYVNQKRIQQATHLLTSTTLQIQTVAQHSGFADMNYFSKVFKKYTGKTPTVYRKENTT